MPGKIPSDLFVRTVVRRSADRPRFLLLTDRKPRKFCASTVVPVGGRGCFGSVVWTVLIVGTLFAGAAVGVLAVGDPVPDEFGEAVRRFMVGAGPFWVVSGVSMAACLAVDDLSGPGRQ